MDARIDARIDATNQWSQQIDIANESLPQGVPVANLTARSFDARESVERAMRCQDKSSSAGAMRCPQR
jgi:hypothetical protein